MKEALVVGDLLSGVQQRVGFLLGEGVGAPDDGDGEDGVDDDDHGDREEEEDDVGDQLS